jgi:hypothetical protein
MASFLNSRNFCVRGPRALLFKKMNKNCKNMYLKRFLLTKMQKTLT